MRALLRLAAAAFLLTTGLLPAWSDETYTNTKWGYSWAVPDGFESYGEDPTRSGATYVRGAIVLSYWGETLREPDLPAALAASKGYAERDGWNIDFEVTTNAWGAFTGNDGKKRFYRRMILLCDANVASMTVQYLAQDAAKIRPVIEMLEAAFHSEPC